MVITQSSVNVVKMVGMKEIVTLVIVQLVTTLFQFQVANSDDDDDTV